MKKKAAKIKVFIQNRAKLPHTPTKQQFLDWVQAALVKPLTMTEVTIRIVDTAESAALNNQYRHKTGPTNVLSFAYSPLPGEKTVSLGDLVICAELVKQEAEAEQKTLQERWAHLTVHGILHLQGYDHIKPSQAQEMEQLETNILQTLGFTDPYRDMRVEI